MSHELSLAQSHAWNLARTLMTPVILFKVNDNEYGVLPADDLDGGAGDRRLHGRPQGKHSQSGQIPSRRRYHHRHP
ncbi:hypothetical protein NKH10_25365 [Mesorhizobium sp. M1340]|uniref:hypothetical protein n=1 Tax=Mesorhizobium sp. M1340 TaxID=2957087 RepID=UPI0033379C73